ncbi:MAG TPA: histidine--tRNA ligase [Candidatus Paceibacterota bacterium]
MAKLPTEPYKGVRDFYPEDEALQQYLFSTMSQVVERFGYARYDASILEPSELYKNKGAENEEIVNEQTYTFIDRGDREVTLRPEMTPSVARMVAARKRELAFPLRWYSIPNVFRYERPQRGRLREHWQLNVDLFGSRSVESGVEVIAIAHAILKAFGAKDSDFIIKLNSRSALNRAFDERGFDYDTRHNICTLLDRKAKMPAAEFEEKLHALAGDDVAFTQTESDDVAATRRALAELGITNTEFDPSIIRGFDYYTGIVFEIFDTDPQNNRSLFGGGRYDNLLSLFSDETVPAVGFGVGDVTLRDFLEVRGLLPRYTPPARVYLAVSKADIVSEAMKLAEELRAGGVQTAIDFGDRKLGDQIKAADKQHIPFMIVVGEDELASGEFTVKELATGKEEKVSRAGLGKKLKNESEK